jgi:hypothetical protein
VKLAGTLLSLHLSLRSLKYGRLDKPVAAGPNVRDSCACNHISNEEERRMKKVLSLAIAACALSACATTGESNDGPIVEKQYRTGSNLAVRHSSQADGVTTVSKEDMDRARDSSLNAGAGIPAPRPGGR